MTGVVTLASAAYGLEQDYLIEITAMSSDGGAPSIARFTIMPNEPIRIEPAPAASILREGESQDITFSFAKADLEVKRISAGESHSCAITSDNRAVCWGNNQGNKATPPSGKKFIAVSASYFHSCGITSDNDAVCWGSSPAVNPPQDEKFIAIGAGAAHSCGITAGNDVFCWGSGPGLAMPPAGGKYIAISSGQAHNCAITFDNDAVCWGLNSNRQSAPPAGRKFIAISAGASHSCGITADNKAVCWGSNDSKRASPASAADVDANTRFLAVSAGASHSCGIKADGAAVCWGFDGSAMTQTDPMTSPQDVNADTRFLAVSVGFSHTCGITYDNGVACWGFAMHGRTSPPQVPPTAADPITITATVSDADRGQLGLSDNGQVVIPAGETQITLTVTVADDNVREPETGHAIALSAAGHIELEEDELIITVPVDDGDTEAIGDIDNADNAVAENSPIGAEVGIIALAGDATRLHPERQRRWPLCHQQQWACHCRRRQQAGL